MRPVTGTTGKLSKLPLALAATSHPARLWSPGEAGRVKCHLSPRECNIPPGGLGFCGVRHNDGGRLVTLNYGKSVAMTRESIESEAVYHYAPGEPILSLGNIGCMMACDYCHNWQTSQARLAKGADIRAYSSEEIVAYALRHGIRVLSWTYNDPVVWQEFVVDTARLARRHGLVNLYKSAFYIGPRAVAELCEVIDIFSLSLKSMDPDFYRKHTKGRLEPVLAAIEQVHAAPGKPHLEISNLAVTGRNDNLEDARRVADWVLETLGPDVPLHYVRFHPDFKYTEVERTSIPFLEEARRQALAIGLRHVYVGNVSGTDSANTRCLACGELLVERRGTAARRFLSDGACPRCGASSGLVLPWPEREATARGDLGGRPHATYWFRAGVQAFHVEQDGEDEILFQLVDEGGGSVGALDSTTCARFLIANSAEGASGVRVYHLPARAPRVLEVLDRAHFPVAEAAP
jgi:pyruvate formate lyase activating enzyme